ncbi:MAG: phosphotransferase enzyme family protein [Micromonosporaceae bacterium]
MSSPPPHRIRTVEPHTHELFTPQATRTALAAACRQAGLDPTDATLLRHQTAAVYHLARHPVVVKIHRPEQATDHVARAVALTRWLAAEGLPTVTPAAIPQPVEVAGCAVTFWRHLPQPADRPVTAGHLGALLRHLHQLPAPPVTPRTLDAPRAILRSLLASRILTDDERQFLTTHAETVFRRMNTVNYTLPPGLIHGDPQHRNALWDGPTPVLADWDSAVAGPREWDLATVEVHCRRFGHPDTEYRAFADAYHHDIRQWPGFPALRDLRELRMITTNARKSPPGTPAAAEVHRRITALRQQRHDARWRIL